MRINRRTFLLTAAGAVACARRAGSSSLQRAVEYLWTQQAEDGGFHSNTYGLLRSGQSLTPFVLDALLRVPETASPANRDGTERALAFIKKNLTSEGALGLANATSADYPNYATSLALSVMTKAGRDARREIDSMVQFLRAQQFCESNGWKADHPVYGGWGMGGAVRRPPETGHVDLSMTRCALEALRAAGVPSNDPAVSRALVYVGRSQNTDGGFYFSTVNPEINKAGETESGFASYGAATADGLLLLRAAGVSADDGRVVKAVQWLRSHHQPDRAPGFEGTAREAWGSGLRFYYSYVISRTTLDLPISLPSQESDGSYRNTNNMVKEDDPLIATTFAVHALTRQV